MMSSTACRSKAPWRIRRPTSTETMAQRLVSNEQCSGQKSDSWLGGESRKMDGPGGMLSPRNGRKTSAQGHPLDGWQRVSAFKRLFAEKVSRWGIETGILLSERPFRQKQEPFLAGKRRRVEPNDLNFRTETDYRGRPRRSRRPDFALAHPLDSLDSLDPESGHPARRIRSDLRGDRRGSTVDRSQHRIELSRAAP